MNVSQSMINEWEENNFFLKVDGVRAWIGDYYFGSVFEFETMDGYVFEYIGTYDPIFESWDYLELSDGGRIAKISDTDIDLDDLQWSLKEVEGGGDPDPEDPEPELPTISVDQYLIDDWNEDNFHLEVDGVPVVTGGDYSGEEFTFVADGNYVFVSVGFYDIITETTTELELSPDRKIAYLPAEMVEDIDWRDFRYDLELSEEVETSVRGANSVFRVSDEALKEITHKRFDLPTSGSNVDDFGKFILGLIELPFEVGEEYVLGTEPVRLGRLNTGVMGDILSVDRMSFDLGSISVGEEFGDFRDYQDVVAVLHLPYAESVVLETEYVVGQEISIELVVSLYDGSADYVIRSSFADGVALTQKVHLEVDVPFANVDGVPQRNSPSNMTFGVQNGVYTAYVELKRRETLLVDGMFTIPVVDEATLGEQSGFVRVEEIKLEVECTAQEMDMLESVLKEGVFIK